MKKVILYSFLIMVPMVSYAQTKKEPSKVAKKLVLKYIKKLKKVGFIKKVDKKDSKVYVNDYLWKYESNGPRKVMMTKWLSAYMAILYGLDKYTSIKVCSYNTGEVFAKMNWLGKVKVLQ